MAAVSMYNDFLSTAAYDSLQTFGDLKRSYNGGGQYSQEIDGDEYIRVDKGSPDKAKYVVFYAELKAENGEIVDDDPMIFVKTEEELQRECEKLAKRKDVDITSIRIFALVGSARVEFDLPESAKPVKKEKK